MTLLLPFFFFFLNNKANNLKYFFLSFQHTQIKLQFGLAVNSQLDLQCCCWLIYASISGETSFKLPFFIATFMVPFLCFSPLLNMCSVFFLTFLVFFFNTILKVEMRKEEPKFDLCPDNCPIFFPLITCIRIKQTQESSAGKGQRWHHAVC